MAQLFDHFGKSRALVIKDGDLTFTAIFQPAVPSNLPTGQVSFASAEAIINYFESMPQQVSRNNKSEVTGLWYAVSGFENFIYIPVDPTSDPMFDNILTGDDDPLGAMAGTPGNLKTDDHLVAKQNKIVRDLEIIKQLLIWLYLIAGKPPLDVFASNYFEIGPPVGSENSHLIYDFSQLNWILPRFNDIELALKYLDQNVPTFVANGMVFCIPRNLPMV